MKVIMNLPNNLKCLKLRLIGNQLGINSENLKWFSKGMK